MYIYTLYGIVICLLCTIILTVLNPKSKSVTEHCSSLLLFTNSNLLQNQEHLHNVKTLITENSCEQVLTLPCEVVFN